VRVCIDGEIGAGTATLIIVAILTMAEALRTHECIFHKGSWGS